METSWQTETGRLVCRWSPEVGEAIRYDSSWIQEASVKKDWNVSPSIHNFATHSALGSGEWCAPWNIRWSLPRLIQAAP